MIKPKKDTVFYKKLWNLMIPIVLQNLMLALVAVADAFMLGGLDQNYMSAVSLATQIQFIQNMFLAAATASLGILGAQYWGKGDIRTLDDIFCMALRLCGLVSIVFFAGVESLYDIRNDQAGNCSWEYWRWTKNGQMC